MKNQKGFVQLLILLLVVLIALSYFGIDLEQVFAKPLIRKNVVFTWNTAQRVWNDYIYDPISGLFNKNDNTGTVDN